MAWTEVAAVVAKTQRVGSQARSSCRKVHTKSSAAPPEGERIRTVQYGARGFTGKDRVPLHRRRLRETLEDGSSLSPSNADTSSIVCLPEIESSGMADLSSIYWSAAC